MTMLYLSKTHTAIKFGEGQIMTFGMLLVRFTDPAYSLP
jgi:hypothetical protein